MWLVVVGEVLDSLKAGKLWSHVIFILEGVVVVFKASHERGLGWASPMSLSLETQSPEQVLPSWRVREGSWMSSLPKNIDQSSTPKVCGSGSGWITSAGFHHDPIRTVVLGSDQEEAV